MFDRVSFLVHEALQNLRRHPFMTFSAVSVVAIALTMMGGIGFLYIETKRYAESLPGRFDMYVVLKEGTALKDISETAQVIRGLPGVGSVNWIPRDKAWARERQLNPKFTEGIENPLPDAYKVKLTDLNRSDAVAAAIRQLPAIDPEDGLRYAKDEQQAVSGMLNILQWLGSFGTLLFVVAGILIYNTIRLAAIARRVEVRIMRLVGASRVTVATPFMLEGMMEGAAGGFLSAMFLWGAQRLFTREFGSMMTADALAGLSNPAAPSPSGDFPVTATVLSLTLLGTVYGAICSLVALRLRPETR
jgi:cell division transport system permease protein